MGTPFVFAVPACWKEYSMSVVVRLMVIRSSGKLAFRMVVERVLMLAPLGRVPDIPVCYTPKSSG